MRFIAQFVNSKNTKRKASTKVIPLLRGVTEGDGVDTADNNRKPSWKENSLFPFWNLPKNKNLETKAKNLRKNSTLSEVIFWKSLRNKTFLGYDIDRQVIIGNYIVDFFVAELGLVVEIDGSSHEIKGDYDQDREKYLLSLGLEILHYADISIKKALSFVSDSFYLSIKSRERYLMRVKEESTPSASRPPLKEGNI